MLLELQLIVQQIEILKALKIYIYDRNIENLLRNQLI